MQGMGQQLQALQQNIMQMEAAHAEADRALEAIKDLPDDAEIYKTSGLLLFKTEVPRTRTQLEQERELLEMRIKTMKSKFEELETNAKNLESKIRKEMGI